MQSKLFILFFCFLFWSNERFMASGYIRRISKPSVYKWNEKIRPRVSDEPVKRQYTDCGGKITKGPGTIEQFFVSRNPMHKVNCTWRIHAPENHHVYVKQLRITRTTLQNADASKFDDAPFIQVFDGKDMTEENRLFRFGDANLNRCLSSEQDLTISLTYNESGRHIDQEAVIKYGFVESSIVEDLIP
ncbi:uncharacterized protein LOC107980851 [Nasonia vitripennis]|uniref:CUB domain-containing protein n=1 Tax=Nasonia vitripennis TaxID=7425 RepID=A0A7M7M1W7_NASVI|nr:uncharacterized protein LOC107980851 [Nasonia vitripennis]